MPAGSVARARKDVVELSGTETVIPGEENWPALDFAAGVPVHPAVLYIFTVVPAAAVPLTFGLLLLAGEAGVVPVIDGVPGGWVSTVNERDRTVLTFPGASIALTKKAWPPSVRWPTVKGELQALNAVCPTWHWKVEPASLETNENRGVGLLIKAPFFGPAVIVA